MKHIKSFKKFESKITNDDVYKSGNYQNIKEFILDTKNDIWDEIFGKENRLYFDMNGNKLSKKSVMSNKSNTLLLKDINDLYNIEKYDNFIYDNNVILKDIVMKILNDLKFIYIDYENNKCSKISSHKNVTTISSILSSKLIGEYRKIDILNKYQNRYNINVLHQPVIGNNEYMIVLSRHPVDMLAMSTGRKWHADSCMKITNKKHKYIYADIKAGSVICYQTNISDYNINTPIARILFKPYRNENDFNDIVLYGDKIYGKSSNNFAKISNEIVNKLFNHTNDGFYNLDDSLYADDKLSRITLSNNEIEKVMTFDYDIEMDSKKYNQLTELNKQKYIEFLFNEATPFIIASTTNHKLINDMLYYNRYKTIETYLKYIDYLNNLEIMDDEDEMDFDMCDYFVSKLTKDEQILIIKRFKQSFSKTIIPYSTFKKLNTDCQIYIKNNTENFIIKN